MSITAAASLLIVLLLVPLILWFAKIKRQEDSVSAAFRPPGPFRNPLRPSLPPLEPMAAVGRGLGQLRGSLCHERITPEPLKATPSRCFSLGCCLVGFKMR